MQGSLLEAVQGPLLDFDWTATTYEGRVLRRADLGTVEHLSMDRVRRMEVRTGDARMPVVVLGVRPERGERLRVFARRCVRLGARGNGRGAQQEHMLVFEVTLEPGSDRFVRLYLHPVRGAVLSTEDLDL